MNFSLLPLQENRTRSKSDSTDQTTSLSKDPSCLSTKFSSMFAWSLNPPLFLTQWLKDNKNPPYADPNLSFPNLKTSNRWNTLIKILKRLINHYEINTNIFCSRLQTQYIAFRIYRKGWEVSFPWPAFGSIASDAGFLKLLTAHAWDLWIPYFVHMCFENTCKHHLNDDRLLLEIPWSCHVPRRAKWKEMKLNISPQNLLDLSTIWKSLV